MHQYELVGITADTIWWQCPSCGKAIEVGRGRSHYRVLRQGDESVQHVGETGGVVMETAEVTE